MMQSGSTVAEPIVVNLTPPDVKVAAGADPVEIIANVRNAGGVVDQFSIEVQNLDPSWYTVLVESVALFPGDSAPIPIRLHPPKGGNTRAGHYTFAVVARSHADPTLMGVTKGVVTVGSFLAFQLELAPKRVTGRRGKYKLSITNAGNGDAQFELSGVDAEANMGYSFRPSTPNVPAGRKLVVPMTVRTKGFKLVGMSERYAFKVNARPVDGTEKDAKEVEGELIHKPWFDSWRRPMWLLGLLAMILLFILFNKQLNPCSQRFLLPSNVQFYSSFLCAGGELKIGGPEKGIEPGAVPADQACKSGPGFEEVREKYNTLVGNCTMDEWKDDNGNVHQGTTKGELFFVWLVRPADDDARNYPDVPVARPDLPQAAQMYFLQNDGEVYTFVECEPKGTFNECTEKQLSPPAAGTR